MFAYLKSLSHSKISFKNPLQKASWGKQKATYDSKNAPEAACDSLFCSQSHQDMNPGENRLMRGKESQNQKKNLDADFGIFKSVSNFIEASNNFVFIFLCNKVA